jgi:uncharacterized membrane protein/predicted DsbA family dithiol-disulfide isomerase
MSRYLNFIQIISAAGIALSSILLYQHYHPNMDMGIISCGKGFVNPCISVGQSDYAVIFGVPIAALGLLFYLFITFMLLVADYAGDKYLAAICGIILPVAVTGVAADIVLAVIMFRIGSICNLCVATYVVNIAILMLLLIMINKYIPLKEIFISVKNILSPVNPDQRAVLALTLLFVFFAGFSVLSGSELLRLRAGINRPSDKEITHELASFYRNPVSDIVFPGSSMTAGSSNPLVKIHVFTDFLCSACYKFYETEKYLLAKYGGNIQFIYYHYPLDSACNKYLDDSLYPESCTASKSMQSAAAAGFFEEYFFTHFNEYHSIKENYDAETAKMLADKTSSRFHTEKEKLRVFNELFNAADLPAQITADIEFAEKMKISGTPAVYINGRGFNGVPRREMLEAIILNELKPAGK